MARLSPQEWEKARVLYEVDKFSFEKIGEILGVDKSSVKRTSDRQGWNREKTQQLIVDNVKANKWLNDLEQQTQLETQQMQRAIKDAVRDGLALFGIGQTMIDVAKSLSKVARIKAMALEASADEATNESIREVMTVSQSVNEASKIPMKMWEVENKTPDTAIQINNQTGQNLFAQALEE